MRHCTSCGNELGSEDRFCGRCGAVVLKLVSAVPTEGSGGEGAKEGKEGEGEGKAGKAEVISVDDFVTRGAAIGAAVAEHFIPGSPMAKSVGLTLGSRIAHALVGSPLISFGTDQASVALAKATMQEKARQERRERRKKKKKEPSR